MTYTLKLRSFGRSVGAIIPQEVLGKLKVQVGDTLLLSEDEKGYRLSVQDPGVEAAMKIYRRVARKYRSTLRDLSD